MGVCGVSDWDCLVHFGNPFYKYLTEPKSLRPMKKEQVKCLINQPLAVHVQHIAHSQHTT